MTSHSKVSRDRTQPANPDKCAPPGIRGSLARRFPSWPGARSGFGLGQERGSPDPPKADIDDVLGAGLSGCNCTACVPDRQHVVNAADRLVAGGADARGTVKPQAEPLRQVVEPLRPKQAHAHRAAPRVRLNELGFGRQAKSAIERRPEE